MIEDKFLDLLLSDLASSSGNVPKNWAGNISYGARFLFEPATISEVQDIVARMPSIKVVGTRHSFNQVADCPGGALVSLQKLTSSPELVTNTKSPTVTVSGETTYSELNNFLHERGLALRNLASLPHISVAGSIATATHGSGDRNRCLAADVVGLSIIKADGNLVTVSRESHGSDFDGMVVSLGALGVVVDVTLAVVPTYDVSQVVYDDVPMDIVVGNLDDLFAAGYSVSLFTLWQQNQFHQVWVKQVAGLDVLPEVLQGQSVATTGRHPIPGVTGESCTKQLNQAGPWHHRLPHFRPEFVPSHGNELQSEFLVPRQYAQDAIVTIMKLGAIVTPHLHVSEVRSIAADSLWMSPFYETPCIGIHFTWKNDWAKVEPILKKIELALGPHAARPHWGKLFATPIAQTAALYPRFAEFRDLVRSWDPCGKFANPFLKELLASESDNSH